MSNSSAENYFVVIFVRLDPLSTKLLRRWLIRWAMKYVCVCLFLSYNQIIPHEHAFFMILNMVLVFCFCRSDLLELLKECMKHILLSYTSPRHINYTLVLQLSFFFFFWGGVGGGMCENVQPYIVVTGWTVQCHDRWVMRQSVSVLTFALLMPSTLQ